MTHGFFKGLLFLDSGSVIHAVHEEQDMRKMGGLSTKIPITYVTMLIGSLAIAGIPPLAGFFSKDEILGESLKLGFVWVWAIGFVVAGLTAFYMFRLMGMTFWGTFRGPKEIWDKIHESPPVMTIPLILLAIPSVFLGMYLGPAARREPDPASGSRRSSPRARRSSTRGGARSRAYQLFGIDGVLIIASVTIATIGADHRLAAVRRRASGRSGCRPGPERVRELTARAPFLYRASLNKWWFDDLYHFLFMVIGGKIAAACWWFDREVIDGTVNAIGTRHHRRRARAAPGPDRPGPELRPGHRHRPHRDGRLVPAAGGSLSVDVNSIPILSIVIFLPLIGALLIAIAPASLGAAARPRLRGPDLHRVAAAARRLPARTARASSSSRRLVGSPSSASSTSSGPTGCRSPWSC